MHFTIKFCEIKLQLSKLAKTFNAVVQRSLEILAERLAVSGIRHGQKPQNIMYMHRDSSLRMVHEMVSAHEGRTTCWLHQHVAVMGSAVSWGRSLLDSGTWPPVKMRMSNRETFLLLVLLKISTAADEDDFSSRSQCPHGHFKCRANKCQSLPCSPNSCEGSSFRENQNLSQ